MLARVLSCLSLFCFLFVSLAYKYIFSEFKIFGQKWNIGLLGAQENKGILYV